MFLDDRLDRFNFAPGFPCSGGPFFCRLVGHRRQGIEDLTKILFRNDPEGLATTNQAVEDRTRLSRGCTAKEKPILFTDSCGPNCVFNEVVIDFQFGVLGINRQLFPSCQSIVNRTSRQTFWSVASLCLKQHLSNLIENRHTFFLPENSSIEIGMFSELRLDLIE